MHFLLCESMAALTFLSAAYAQLLLLQTCRLI
jgi:hypothetical protein